MPRQSACIFSEKDYSMEAKETFYRRFEKALDSCLTKDKEGITDGL